MTEHEHGLGASGLRRIRQQHPASRHPTITTAIPSTLDHRVVSSSSIMALSLPQSRVVSHASTSPNSPISTTGEDLTRFPSESLHSFSFAHQSEEPMHARQNVLRRSIEFLRERTGWVAANPGLATAQAKVSGDAELQSMVELVSRAGLMSSPLSDDRPDAGLHISTGPLTGPAEVEGGNLFEKSFVALSASPDEYDARSPSRALARAGDGQASSSSSSSSPADRQRGSQPAELNAAASMGNQISPPDALKLPDRVRGSRSRKGTARPRSKRTYTDLEPLSMQEKLMDTLAVPYLANDSALRPQTTASPTLAGSAVPSRLATTPARSALHAHSSRWAPATQAIFTTEASAPWTIVAANDLACLVFGVTQAEVGKLGILEVLREERRAWLEERLRSPGAHGTDARQPDPTDSRTRPTSPTSPTSRTSALAPSMGNGYTAALLSKPSWRDRRSKTAGGTDPKPAEKAEHADTHRHSHRASRGVLLCGDVVPIQKRNGVTGAASLWVKEKRGGLIWVLEEITEDVAYIELDRSGRVVKESGSTAPLWGFQDGVTHKDVSSLIPQIPRAHLDGPGAVDLDAIGQQRHFAIRNAEKAHTPATVEPTPDGNGLRVASFPHIAGVMVISAATLEITSSNSVFSAALFGRDQPRGLHITALLPEFERVLGLLFKENGSEPVDGLVIPEYSFRRARALLAIREGSPDAAMALLHPNGLAAKHRDGSELKVDVQMRVVKHCTFDPDLEEAVIVDGDTDDHDGGGGGGDAEAQGGCPKTSDPSDSMYALWITYSRQLHSTGEDLNGGISPLLARCQSPLHQPSPGQTRGNVSPPDVESDHSSRSDGCAKPPLSEQIREAVAEPIAARDVDVRSSNGEKQTRSTGQQARPPQPLSGPHSPSSPPTTATTTATTATTIQDQPPRDGKTPKNAKKTIDDFVILEDMGQGAYGQVKLARDKQNGARKMVLKYVTKRRILVDTWTRDRRLGTVPLEIHVLDYLRRDGLRHPNIVEMSDFFEDDVNYYIEMVPHGLPGMDLFDYIELRVNMDESECRSIFRQVTNAVHHLHNNALVVHRDIKDENVILDGEGKIKLIDFGSATYIKNGPFDVFVGTIGVFFFFLFSPSFPFSASLPLPPRPFLPLSHSLFPPPN